MKFFVYILQSLKNNDIYVGSTENVGNRLRLHNAGKVKSTKHMRPWKVVYTESFGSATEARKREYFLKTQKSRKLLESLIARYTAGD